jgi:drug/metabolite transporter (DMT)-like permease
MSLLFLLAGLGASLSYGISDFVGGRASARLSIVQVLVIGEIFGALLLWGLAGWYAEPLQLGSVMLIAIGAGMVGAIGVAALYHGLSQGYTAITAPVSAVLAAVLPILYGLQSDGLPSPLAISGMVIGVVAIVLNSLAGRVNGYQGLWQGLVAGVAFGVYFILLKYVGTIEETFAPLAFVRSAALIITIPWLLIRPGGRPNTLGFILAIVAGLFDVAATSLYVLATQTGRLDLASVLASLYPAVTVLLARFISHEPLTRMQRIGLVATLIATTLIAL